MNAEIIKMQDVANAEPNNLKQERKDSIQKNHYDNCYR